MLVPTYLHDFCLQILLTMIKADTEGDISRTNLERHGIFYERRVYQVPNASGHSTSFALPDHIDAIREGLLSFHSSIPEEWKKDLNEEFGGKDIDLAQTHRPPESAFITTMHHERDRSQRSADWRKADRNFKRFHNVAKHARDLHEHAEEEWNVFWRSEVFKRFRGEAHQQHGNT